jgi:hypothetical protein
LHLAGKTNYFCYTGMAGYAATKTKALIRTTTGLWPFTDVQFIEI